jgi:hypothetical protein
MDSKTPKFDILLDSILKKVVPCTIECSQKTKSKYCEGEFKITNEDIEFYKILRVPPPKKCPTCRRQNRFAFINSINLYKRDNYAPERNNKIISFVPPVSKLIVYDLESYKEEFDAMDYGINYDPDKNFFDQLFKQRLKIPQPAIVRDPSNINSEYSLNGRNLKNGYYVSGGWNSENVWYSVLATNSRNVMDATSVHFIENSYEMVSCEKCYNCKYLYYSDNCINSSFLYDCNNCIDCFGCVNLRNKSNCIWNKQYSKEEYEQKIKDFSLDKLLFINEMKEKFWEFVKSHPVRAERHEKTENVSGINIANCKNCHDVIEASESVHLLHCEQIVGHKDSMDVSVSGGSEKLYQTISVGSKCSNVKFSFASKFILESEFVINCRNVEYCFACIGLENKSYYIFNQQYEKEEYYKIVDEIKYNLLKKGEYGEFFPYEFSTFAYNGSLAGITFPLDEKEILERGFLWQNEVETDTANLEIVSRNQIPDSIFEVEDSIFEKAILCKETHKPFRITKSELEFYKNNHIPIPDTHPNQRMKNRYNNLGNFRMLNDICSLCDKKIKTMYDSKTGWLLYCDDCFKREIL